MLIEFILGAGNPQLDAVVPAVGFNISTWSLSYIKLMWVQSKTNVWRKEVAEIFKQRPDCANADSIKMEILPSSPMKYYQTGYVYV